MSQPSAATKHPVNRWIENGHIYLWLLKDICWVSEYKLGGMIMIVPTIAVALYILVKSWHIRAEAFHNGAVCLWIFGNSFWMLGEFFDKKWEPITAGLFATGILLLSYYYLFLFRADRRKEKAVVQPA